MGSNPILSAINGESEKILEKILIEENLTENDGTPILNEIKIIENQIENYKNINVIIDDIRLFGKNF